MSTKYPPGKHPNSLKNLVEPWGDSENAKKAQLAGAAKKRANREAREKLKMDMGEWKKYKTEVLDTTDMSSIDVLKILMMKALEQDDYERAADLAKSLAEYEKPKLARVESTVEEVSTDELSDDELNARIKELMNGENDSSSGAKGSS